MVWLVTISTSSPDDGDVIARGRFPDLVGGLAQWSAVGAIDDDGWIMQIEIECDQIAEAFGSAVDAIVRCAHNVDFPTPLWEIIEYRVVNRELQAAGESG